MLVFLNDFINYYPGGNYYLTLQCFVAWVHKETRRYLRTRHKEGFV